MENSSIDLFSEQRVFTPQEYALLGYTLRSDITFDSGSYDTDSVSLPTWVPHYRSDTREEYYVDVGYITTKFLATMNPYTTMMAIMTSLY